MALPSLYPVVGACLFALTAGLLGTGPATGAEPGTAANPPRAATDAAAAPAAAAAAGAPQWRIGAKKVTWFIRTDRFGTSMRSLVASEPCSRLTSASQTVTVCLISNTKVRVKHRGYNRTYRLRARLRAAAGGFTIRINRADLMLRKGRASLVTFCKDQACTAPRSSGARVRVPARRLATCTARAPFKVNSKDTRSKVVALTLDDGPGPYTRRALKVLRQKGVPATFFVVGQHAEYDPATLHRIMNQGHVLGNHTYSHAVLSRLSSGAAIGELNRSNSIIRRATGFLPCLFRAPQGEISESGVRLVSQQGMTTIGWNATAHDYLGLGRDRIVRDVLSTTRPGSIILLHDGGGNRAASIDSLPMIIDNLRNRGYRFVTVPDLLKLRSTYR